MLGLSYAGWLLAHMPTESLHELDRCARRYDAADPATRHRILGEFAVSGAPVARMVAARYVPTDELGTFLDDVDLRVVAMAAGRPDCLDVLLLQRLRRAAQDRDDPAHDVVGAIAATATGRLEMDPATLEALVELWVGSLLPEQKAGDVPLTAHQTEQAVHRFLRRPELPVRSYQTLRAILPQGYEFDVTSGAVFEHLAEEARTTGDLQLLERLRQTGNLTIAGGVAANPRLDVEQVVALLRDRAASVCRGAASNAVVPMVELRRALGDSASWSLSLVDGACENPNVDEETLCAALEGLVAYGGGNVAQDGFARSFAKLMAHARLPYERLVDALPTLRSASATNEIIDAALARGLSEDEVRQLFMILACDVANPKARALAREHRSCPGEIRAASALVG